MTPQDLQSVADGKRLMDSNEQQQVAKELIILREAANAASRYAIAMRPHTPKSDWFTDARDGMLGLLNAAYDAAREGE